MRRPDALRLARDWRFVLASFAASGVGYLGSSAAPVIVQALIDAGIDHRRAGDLGTIELLTLAACALAATPLVTRVSHRGLALGGAIGAALGAALCALSEGYGPMVLGRIVLGAGSGLAIAGANAAISAREDAERIFAIIWTLGGGVTAALAFRLPLVVEGGNYARGFGALVLLCLAALPLLFWIPPRPPGLGDATAWLRAIARGEARSAAGSVRKSPHSANPFGALALLALAGIFAYSVAEQALWQFSYDIAVDHGIPYDTVRYVLAAATVAGLTGGALAACLGLRWGRLAPLLVGSLLSLAGRWLYIEAGATQTLVAATLLWGVGYYFVSPYQIGLVAALDRRGRVAVAATAVTNLGYGLGPMLGGRLRQYQLDQGLDAGVLVAVVAGATVLSLLLLLPAALRLDRSAAS